MSLEKSDDMLSLLQEFREHVQPLAFEFWTDKALEYVLSHGSIDFSSFREKPLFMFLVELEEREAEKAFTVFERAFNKKTC